MSKNENRSKESYDGQGERGRFYYQKKCFHCGKLIWGSSSKNRHLAGKDCYFKMQIHLKECQGKQLKFSIPGKEQEQSKSIERVTLTGEEK